MEEQIPNPIFTIPASDQQVSKNKPPYTNIKGQNSMISSVKVSMVTNDILNDIITFKNLNTTIREKKATVKISGHNYC